MWKLFMQKSVVNTLSSYIMPQLHVQRQYNLNWCMYIDYITFKLEEQEIQESGCSHLYGSIATTSSNKLFSKDQLQNIFFTRNVSCMRDQIDKRRSVNYLNWYLTRWYSSIKSNQLKWRVFKIITKQKSQLSMLLLLKPCLDEHTFQMVSIVMQVSV